MSHVMILLRKSATRYEPAIGGSCFLFCSDSYTISSQPCTTSYHIRFKWLLLHGNRTGISTLVHSSALFVTVVKFRLFPKDVTRTSFEGNNLAAACILKEK